MVSVALNNKNIELKKHVNAIHCSNNLTLVQRKLFNALLFNAYPNLPHKQTFEIKGKDLYKLIGYNSKDTGKLKDALLGLITIAIEWNVIDCSSGQEKKWKASSILASAELSNGICSYEYSQVMRDFLYQPEIYGKINIELVSQFKSGYGLALYENCIRYKGLTQTPWFPIDVFRKLMGVYDDKYQAFKDFKKRVLDVGVTEVNSISPIKVIPEIERVNQKVVKIRFILAKSIDHISMVLTENIIDDELNRILIDTFGFSDGMVDEVFSKYEQNYIREKIEIIIQSENFLGGKIRGLAGYLTEALKKDYKPSRSSRILVDERRKIKEQKENDKIQREKDASEKYKAYITKKINGYMASLTSEQHQELMDEFDEYMKFQNSTALNFYRKYGLDHPAVKASFNNYIKEMKKENIGLLLSMDELLELLE
ncbi:MAG: repA protein [Legionella sp.]|nr:MAG: repA protein [Legionella sp.]